MQTRRKFLRDCSVAAATASLIPTAALADKKPAPRPAIVPKESGLPQFARQLNTFFTVQTDSSRIKLRLAGADSFSAAVPNAEDARNEKFRLLFHGPAQQPLGQDTYLFEHPRMGRQSIFIVPIGSPETGHCVYEAIFDRPVNPRELALQLARAPRRPRKR